MKNLTPAQDSTYLCVGIIMGARGVRGSLKVKSFTEVPKDILSYGPLLDAKGKVLEFSYVTATPKHLVLNLKDIGSREEAEKLRGIKIFTSRDAFPELEEDEYYVSDLIGLAAESLDGDVLGTVKNIENYGAGDILEIQGEGQNLMIPFTKACVPHLDFKKKVLVVDLSLLEDQTEST